MKRIVLLLLAVPVFLLFACQDRDPTAPDRALRPPPDPRAHLLDGVHNNGNPHFFWLPPMVAQPTYAGTFNGAMSPKVEICEWDGTACVAAPMATYTRTSGPGGETIRVNTIDENYHVNWHTDQFALKTDAIYRVTALLGQMEIGHADVRPVSSGGQMKNVDTGQYIALVDGRTLPVKFRIENLVLVAGLGGSDAECAGADGVLGTSDDECVEATVDPAQQTDLTVPSGKGGASFPAGFTEEPINVLIQRLPTPCLTTDMEQFPACYRYVAEPDVTFDLLVTVGMCLEQVTAEAKDQVQLHKQEELNGIAVGPVEPLPEAAAPFLTGCSSTGPVITGLNPLLHLASGRAFFAQESCDSPASWGEEPRARLRHKLARAGRRLLSPVALLGLPAPAAGCDDGYGGTTGSFSRVEWARPVTIAQAPATTTTTADPSSVTTTIKATPLHYPATQVDPVAADVTLSYVVSDPNGPTTAAPLTIQTDANGLAPISFSPTIGGVYTLDVTAPGTNVADRVNGALQPRAVPTVQVNTLVRGLVSRWPAEGTYEDAAGPNEGTPEGTVAFADGINGGQAFAFSGAADPGVVRPGGKNILDADQITLAGWVYVDPASSLTTIQRFFGPRGKAALFLRGDVAAGRLEFIVNVGPSPVTTTNQDARRVGVSGVLSQGCFHHVAGTYDGSTLHLYLDGKLIASQAEAGVLAEGLRMEIGTPSPAVHGRVDDVEAHNRVLSATEIQALWSAGSSSAPACGIRVAAIGHNGGHQATNAVFSSGDLVGSVDRLTEAQFNALSVQQLIDGYDVLVFTWNSCNGTDGCSTGDANLNADWATRLQPYLDAGRGIIWEDNHNVGDLAPAIAATNLSTGGIGDVTWTLTSVTGLSDGIGNGFVNAHIEFQTFTGFTCFLAGTSATLGALDCQAIYREFTSGGRFVAMSPDQDFHSSKTSTNPAEVNQYHLLVKQLAWAAKVSAPATVASASLQPATGLQVLPRSPAVDQLQLDRQIQELRQREAGGQPHPRRR